MPRGRIRQAEEIKLRAERKAGEILKETVRETWETDKTMSQDTTSKPKLSEIGISRNQSSNWQRIADRAKEKQIEAGKLKQKSAEAPIETRDKLAIIAGVSHDTIHKVEKIEDRI